MAAVRPTGPSARLTARTVTRSRHRARGSSASAQGSPTPANIHAAKGNRTTVGSSQSGMIDQASGETGSSAVTIYQAKRTTPIPATTATGACRGR